MAAFVRPLLPRACQGGAISPASLYHKADRVLLGVSGNGRGSICAEQRGIELDGWGEKQDEKGDLVSRR